MRPISKWTNILMVVVVILFLLVYLLRLNKVAGLYVDDGWYAMLAKSLATGQGYTLLNSPTPGVLPLYPPGYPLLLSLFWRLSPNFPDNLWLLKSVSMVAMLGAGWFIYRFFHQIRLIPRHVALLIALISVSSPSFIYFATETLMSECVYLFFLVAVLYLFEHHLQQRQLTKYLILAGGLAGYALLVRTTGLALLAGIGLCLLWGKLYRPLLIFAVLAAAVSLPWLIYARVHTPSPAVQAEQNNYIVQPYTKQFWQKLAGDEESGEIGVTGLPARAWDNGMQIAARDLGRIVLGQLADYAMYQEAKERALSGGEAGIGFSAYSLLSLIPLVFILIGFVGTLREKVRAAELVVAFSVVMTLLWPFEVIRFLLPLTPFFLFYLVRGLQPITNFYRKLNLQTESRPHYGLAYVLLGLVLLVNLGGNFLYAYQLRNNAKTELPQREEVFQEHQELFQWIDIVLPKDAIVAAANPPLTYLLTGRKTVGIGNPATQWELWKKLGVSHLVFTSPLPLPPPDDYERRFRVAYKTTGRLGLRIHELGPAADRKNWLLGEQDVPKPHVN